MQQYYYDLFEEVFDDQTVLNIAECFKKVNLVLNHSGIVREYRTDGTNFEGFNGKMLTKMHVDIMYTALVITREEGLTDKSTHFGAFIDDGIA
jgi:hypothetical protein